MAIGTTDIGWISSAGIAQAAATYIAYEQWRSAERMNDKQISVMNGYLDMARELHDAWQGNYLPGEQRLSAWALVAQWENLPVDYGGIGSRAQVAAKAAYAGAYKRIRGLGRYCSGLTASMAQTIAVKEAQTIVDAKNYGYRIAEDYAHRREDVNWSRINEVLNRGRGLMSQAVTMSGQGGQIAGRLGANAQANLADAMSVLGFGMRGAEEGSSVIPQGGILGAAASGINKTISWLTGAPQPQAQNTAAMAAQPQLQTAAGGGISSPTFIQTSQQAVSPAFDHKK